jgi:hypothetical protein
MCCRTSSGTTSLPKLRKWGIHQVERHLHGVEAKAMFRGDFEHVEVDARILVARKADIPQLAGPLGVHEGGVGAVLGEDAVWILEADDLMVLDEVDRIHLETAQGFVKLLGGLLLRSAINLGHQENFFTVAVTKRLAHAEFAGALVVVPGVVHEVDAAVNRRADDAQGELFVHFFHAEMMAADADG